MVQKIINKRTSSLRLSKKPHNSLYDNKLFYVLVIPGVIFLILFSYLPLAGLYIAFEDYTYQGGLFGSEFVGFKNFRFFFSNMEFALRATRNTIIINFGNIIVGTVVNVSVAIALNEILHTKFRNTSQTLMLFPHFLSFVVVGVLAIMLLHNDFGLINKALVSCYNGQYTQLV